MNRRKSCVKRSASLTLALLALLNQAVRPLLLAAGANLTAQASGLQPGPEMEGTVFAVTAGNRLLNFNSITPGALNRSAPITGLPSGEAIVGLDFRPRTGQLYALSSASRVYIINSTTASATLIGGAPLNPALRGVSFGFDFNPVPDRIRVVSDARQNLRLNPDSGAVSNTDTKLAYDANDANRNATPNIAGAAYTNNFSGATSTTLYVIDANLDALVRQGSIGGVLSLIAADDNLGGLGNGAVENGSALLLTTLQTGSACVVFVTSAEDASDATGGYTLRLIGNALQTLALPGSGGATVNGALTGGDLQTSAGNFLDAYTFAGVAGDSLQIRLSAASFDSSLLLAQNTGAIIASDDNSGGGATGQDAQITLTLPATGLYVVLATPFARQGTGNYTLTINRNVAALLAETSEPTLGRDGQSRSAAPLNDAAYERFATRHIVLRQP